MPGGRRTHPRTTLRALANAAPIIDAKTTVTEGTKAFIRRLPASWDLVFSESPRGRQANVARQVLVPLPREIRPLVERGERDALLRRLHSFGMAEEQIAKVTGATLEQVRRALLPS
jgi:hypothetical protein